MRQLTVRGIVIAEMDDEGVWTSDVDQTFGDDLNFITEQIFEELSPADGNLLSVAFHTVVELMSGEAIDDTKIPEYSGRVY